MRIPDYLTCLLRNLYAGQEATVRTGNGTVDWSQIGKGVHQGCMLSPCLFNLYAEYLMRNTGLDETQAGIEIAGRNINNLSYADDTTLTAESEEELDGETMERVRDFIFWAPKSLQMVTTAMKLKDTYLLKEKLLPTETAYQKAETLLCQQRSI